MIPTIPALTTITVSLTNQDLAASVTGSSVTLTGGDTGQSGDLTTGNIVARGGSYANFAGVQTASSNTGVGSINQAATALSANANISFTGGGQP